MVSFNTLCVLENIDHTYIFSVDDKVMVISYAIGHHSGANLNPAVSFSLVLGKQLPWSQGLANGIAQIAAGILGACLVAIIFPCQFDLTTTLGSNIVSPSYDPLRTLVAEASEPNSSLACISKTDNELWSV